MGQSMDPAHVEEIPAEINRRQERNNTVHLRHRTAKRNKRSVKLSKLSDEIFMEPLRLIMSSDKRSIQDNIQ